MNHKIQATEHYLRRSAKFLRKHPGLEARLEETLRILCEDPTHPSLDLRPLRGHLSGFHTVRIGPKYRIVLRLDREEGEILLINIGSHDEVYGG